MQEVLFLGYDRSQTRLVGVIEQHDCEVEETGKVVTDFSAYDLVISFGYRHIIRPDALKTVKRPILNLHIAYLPWNRGAHPLFWAAYDETPAGVTIHEIDPGVDTGPICFQRKVDIDYQNDTFASGYQQLIDGIEDLFEQNVDSLLSGDYNSQEQRKGIGSVKHVHDLPEGFVWSDTIAPTIKRLRKDVDA